MNRSLFKRFFYFFLVLLLVAVFNHFFPVFADGNKTSEEKDAPIRIESKRSGLIMSEVPFKLSLEATDKNGDLIRDYDANVILSLEKGQIYQKIDSSLFDAGEIRDWEMLIHNLKVHSSPPVERIWNLLGENIKKKILDWQTGDEISHEMKSKLILELNKILGNPKFYIPGKFQKIKLDKEAMDILGKGTFLETDDIDKWKNFLSRLKRHSTPLTQRVWSLLSERNKKIINAYKVGQKFGGKARQSIIDGINIIIAKKDFYNAGLSLHVKYNDEIQELLSVGIENLDQLHLHKLNRLLIETAFPEDIEGIGNGIGSLPVIPVRRFNRLLFQEIFPKNIEKLKPGAEKSILLPELTGFKSGSLEIEKIFIKKSGKNILNIKADTVYRGRINEGEIIESSIVTEREKVSVIPGILSILPPLIAIGLALAFRQVIISLFCGIWLGATFIYGFNPFTAFFRTIDTIIIHSIADTDHVSIIVFSLFLGGMVAVLSKSGGTQGMVDIISKRAKTSRSGQIATWLMGLFIFFDDYANTLIVGNSMRPLTDKLKISREKLSFIVDSTAAPVTNIAVISTWIGFEISLIADGLKEIGVSKDAYLVFVETIPFRFYPVLTIIFVFLVAYMMRDFGPMLKAERRAFEKGEVLSPTAKPLATLDTSSIKINESIPKRWYNAVVPIISVIIFTLGGLWWSGMRGLAASEGAAYLQSARPFEVLGAANSMSVLIWSSLGGSLVAILMVLVQRIMILEESIACWIEGVKSIIPAVIILTLAWGIGGICKDLHTAQYLRLIAEGNLPPQLLPMLIFVLSAATAFATGTSWGTMSIAMPIAIGLGYYLPPAAMPPEMRSSILLGSIAGVLAGATFGDHCSPISDTTIMSSMASGSDHIDHVRTQAPYALTVAAVGTFLGSIPSGYGLNPFISMVVCTAALFLILKLIGKNPQAKVGDKKPDAGGQESDVEGQVCRRDVPIPITEVEDQEPDAGGKDVGGTSPSR
ncbi:MAG: Na+/H+ antiporter NhaC family protein [Candidatus Eremiobacteraeota bacterium]|nr:Na+/H+ antiporter NhaC family protein [Candidatus Eremiobacteraeota bacterium]